MELKAIFDYRRENFTSGTATVDGRDILFSSGDYHKLHTGSCTDVGEGWTYSKDFVVLLKYRYLYFKKVRLNSSHERREVILFCLQNEEGHELFGYGQEWIGCPKPFCLRSDFDAGYTKESLQKVRLFDRQNVWIVDNSVKNGFSFVTTK